MWDGRSSYLRQRQQSLQGRVPDFAEKTNNGDRPCNIARSACWRAAGKQPCNMKCVPGSAIEKQQQQLAYNISIFLAYNIMPLALQHPPYGLQHWRPGWCCAWINWVILIIFLYSEIPFGCNKIENKYAACQTNTCGIHKNTCIMNQCRRRHYTVVATTWMEQLLQAQTQIIQLLAPTMANKTNNNYHYNNCSLMVVLTRLLGLNQAKFSSTFEPIIADEWLHSVIKNIDTVGCTDASHLLKDQQRHGGRIIKSLILLTISLGISSRKLFTLHVCMLEPWA